MGDIERLKQEVAEKLGISVEELEERLEELMDTMAGVKDERAALELLMARLGLRPTVETPHAIMKICELKVGLRGVSIVARVMRVLPELVREKPFRRVIVADATGEAVLVLFGRALERFNELKISVGDAIVVRRARVVDVRRGMPVLFAGDGSEIDRASEEEFGELIESLPEPRPVISVREAREVAQMLEEDEVEEVDVRGIVTFVSDLKAKAFDGRVRRFVVLRLADQEEPVSIRAVAWDAAADAILSMDVRPGDELVIRGGLLRKRRVTIDGREVTVTTLVITPLSAVEKHGPRVTKIADLELGACVAVYGYVASEPRVRTFERDGAEHRVLSFDIVDDTGRARVVVWNENLIDTLSPLRVGTPVRIVARVRDGLRGPELHISRDGAVEINPPDFPPMEVEIQPEAAEEQLPTLTDISSIEPGSRFNLECVVEDVEFVESQKETAPRCVIIVSDGRLRAKVYVWNEEIAEKAKELVGKRVRFLNVTTPREMRGEVIVRAGERSSVEVLEEAAPEEERAPERVETAIETFESGALVAFVRRVIDLRVESRCEICGSEVMEIGGVKICARGHIGRAKESVVVVLEVDDGKTSVHAEVTGDRVAKLLGVKELKIEEIVKNKESLLESLRRKLVGLPFCIIGTIRTRDGERVLEVEEIRPASSKALAKKMLELLKSRRASS